MDDFAGHEPGRTQQFGRLDDPARRKRRTHRAGRYRPAFVFQRRHDIDSKPEPRALLGQKARRARAVLAEMKIEADRRTADAERTRENFDDEILGRGGRQRRVETS